MFRNLFFRTLSHILLIAFLFSCSTNSPIPESTTELAAFDPSRFEHGEVYQLDSQRSYLQLRIYRSGALAKLGHNHVISTQDIKGNIYRHKQIQKSGVVLSIPVASFVIDDKNQREQAGEAFNSIPTEQDILGTRHNMMSEKVLNAENYPNIQVTSVRLEEKTEEYLATLRFFVAGNTRDIRISAPVVLSGNEILVEGDTSIRQTDLGMEPFSVMMGAISVRNEMDIAFRLLFTKTEASEESSVHE